MKEPTFSFLVDRNHPPDSIHFLQLVRHLPASLGERVAFQLDVRCERCSSVEADEVLKQANVNRSGEEEPKRTRSIRTHISISRPRNSHRLLRRSPDELRIEAPEGAFLLPFSCPVT